MTVAAVIVAGGTGTRFGAAQGKQLALAAGRPVLAWTAAAFDACDDIDAVVLVAHPERLDEYRDAAACRKLVATVPGGETRQASVAAGLAAVPPGTEIVAVHDGARPLVMPETIGSAIAALRRDPGLAGAVVGHPMVDTVKRVREGDEVEATVDRSVLWTVQTPQVFRIDPLLAAYEHARRDAFTGTDDSSLVEREGGRVLLVRGPRDNIKVTVTEDVAIAEAVLLARGRGEADE